MPNLGSRTQGAGRGAPNARGGPVGANLWPMAGQGYNSFLFRSGRNRQINVDLGANGQIGHFAPFPVTLRAPQFKGVFTISGVSRDNTGSALGGCTVDLFQADAFNTWLARTVSDGSGNYSFTIGQQGPFFVRMYLAGSPNRSGTSDNNLTAI